ncbi:A/G-specific adenine glycosylase [Membranicola marinus]|uniref:Adenine DNA glycosylase n=1 Tax=Membranihabitans marinus TaxID=1227546 RepID=A0A953LB10_9BACT|nr:A/G-specific adenine glycosylase [Membranihabitans marinus]MBY5958121.1 A/G-specific adenine glycosylase [Membranihabitans marinus]
MEQPAQEQIVRFGKLLLNWYTENPRPMPWKNFSDPYTIWIAEIILQQTRVEQGTPYFERFIHRFPDLQSLATASIDDVLVLWEGLGYYSRARNLHETARYVFLELGGEFPDTAAGLQKLKGIGPYTSAAIASFAYGESIGVVDGNVKRVTSRYFNIEQDITSSRTSKFIQDLVNRIVQEIPSAEFNQAIMNFGAMMCVPRQPDCASCPARSTCRAYQLKKVDDLPYKSGTTIKKKRWINFGVYVNQGRVAMIQNKSSNIWKNLFIFPVIGSEKGLGSFLESSKKSKAPDLPLLGKMNWELSHRKLHLQFYLVDQPPTDWEQNGKIMMVESKNLENFAIPRPLRLFLNKISYNLSIKKSDDQ